MAILVLLLIKYVVIFFKGFIFKVIVKTYSYHQ